MGVEKEFGCPSCSTNSAMGYSPGTVPMVDTIGKLELTNQKSGEYPQFIAHVGDIRWGLWWHCCRAPGGCVVACGVVHDMSLWGSVQQVSAVR